MTGRARRRWSGEAAATPDDVLVRRTAWRIGAQAAVSVAVIITLLGGVILGVVLRSQRAAADRLLANAVRETDDVADLPSGVWLVVIRPSGRTATPGLPAGLPDAAALAEVRRTGAVDVRNVEVKGVEYRIRTQPHSAAVVQAILDLRAEHAERSRLAEALLLGAALALVFAGVTGAWLGRRAVRPLAAALALQRRFVADASHELRTPLTLLSTRAQVLRRRLGPQDDAKLRSDVDGLVADAGGLAAILDDLLLAADPHAAAPVEMVDLVVVCRQVCAAADAAGMDRGVRITCAGGESPVYVPGAPDSLRRAVTALVDNAVRHADITVTVTVSAVGGQAVVEVADDGPGIEPAMLPRLFERFASAPPRPGGPRGYGLGLALVSEVAARHGGTVTAHNEPGSGAVVRLSLPARSAGMAADLDAPAADPPPAPRRFRAHRPGR